MSKNNKKQHRTDGVFNSNNETYAVPQQKENLNKIINIKYYKEIFYLP